MRDPRSPGRRGVWPLLVALVASAALLSGCAHAQSEAGAAPGYDHYRNARYDYALDYPSRFTPGPQPSNDDGRVFEGDNATLRVFGVQSMDRGLREIAAARIEDPTAASEVQNTRGSVVLVQDRARAPRTVKAIALSGARAAVLVIDGRLASSETSEHVLGSFQPVARTPDTRGETDADTRFHDARLGFSIDKPRGARVEREAGDHVAFSVLGPANAAASEISDGFRLNVVRDPVAADTLAAYAETVRPDGAPSADRVTVGGHEALRYDSRSELGETVTHLLFMPAPGRAYQVSYTISGDRAQYRGQVRAMLESLRFS